MSKAYKMVTRGEFKTTQKLIDANLNNVEIQKITGRHPSSVSLMRRFNTWEDYQGYRHDQWSKRKAKSGTPLNFVDDTEVMPQAIQEVDYDKQKQFEILERIAIALEDLASNNRRSKRTFLG